MENDLVTLRLLLVSGKAHDFKVAQKSTIGDIKKSVFESWPSEWQGEKVESVENLRLLHRGRFLEDNVLFNTLQWGEEAVHTMHLVPKASNKSQAEGGDSGGEGKTAQAGCCIVM